MPRAADLAPHDESLRKGSSQVGACSTDGTDRVTLPDQKTPEVSDPPGEQPTVRDCVERNALKKVGLVLLLCHGGPPALLSKGNTCGSI